MAARLAQLERDVEAARQKLASDLAAIRSPDGFDELRSTLKHAASEIRDEAEDRALSVANGVVGKLKAKAAANPAALLAIGAGLLWHFARRPPITLTLLGVGLLNLMRTPVPPAGQRSGNGFLDEAGSNLMRQAGDALDAVGDAALGAVDAGLDRASVLAADVGSRVEGMADSAAASVRAGVRRARDAALEAGDSVAEAARGGVEAAHDATSNFAARSIEAARAMVGKDRHDQEDEPSAWSNRSNGHALEPAYETPADTLAGLTDYDDQEDEPMRERPAIPVDTLLLGGAGLAVAATCALVLFGRNGTQRSDPLPRARRSSAKGDSNGKSQKPGRAAGLRKTRKRQRQGEASV